MASLHTHDPASDDRADSAADRRARSTGPSANLLRLQRLAGNRAVAAMVAMQRSTKGGCGCGTCTGCSGDHQADQASEPVTVARENDQTGDGGSGGGDVAQDGTGGGAAPAATQDATQEGGSGDIEVDAPTCADEPLPVVELDLTDDEGGGDQEQPDQANQDQPSETDSAVQTFVQRDGSGDATTPKTGTATGSGCSPPSSWAAFTAKPGGNGKNLAAWTVPDWAYSAGAFTASFNGSKSWVDTDRVATGTSRVKPVSDAVTGCEQRFDSGASGVKGGGKGACPAAGIGSYTAASKGECDTVLGASLDKDYVKDAPRLLTHEQYHLKLACVMATLATKALPAGAKKATIKAAFTKMQTDYNKKVDDMDDQTKNGCDSASQATWQKNIDAGTP